jgi:hypothetical protein
VAFLRLDSKEFLKKGPAVKVVWQNLTFINPEKDTTKKPFMLFSMNIGYKAAYKNRPVRYSAKKGKYEIWCHIINSKNLPFCDSNA